MPFLPDRDFVKNFTQEDDYIEGLKVAARDIQERAFYMSKKIMPDRQRQAIVVEEEDGEVIVGNTAHGSIIEEYGSVNSPAFSTMRRAVDAAHFRLKETE